MLSKLKPSSRFWSAVHTQIRKSTGTRDTEGLQDLTFSVKVWHDYTTHNYNSEKYFWKQHHEPSRWKYKNIQRLEGKAG